MNDNLGIIAGGCEYRFIHFWGNVWLLLRNTPYTNGAIAYAIRAVFSSYFLGFSRKFKISVIKF